MKKKPLPYLLFVYLLLFLPLFSGCMSSKQPLTGDHSGLVDRIPSPTPTFEEFARQIFVEKVTTDTISLRYHLSRPENYGITDYPITLGSVADAVTPDKTADDLYAQLLTYDPENFYEEE